ncbi:MAG: extracellular solute-binding protein [Chloroflexi bacterium]|nr:extracellular solute-binding protein [Chloroflexota bacterium]
MKEEAKALGQSRRAFLRTALLMSASALVAACSASTPAPSKPAETKPTETKPTETKPAASKPAETKPTAAAPAAQPAATKPAAETKPATTAPAVKTGGPTGTTIAALGRDYLAYPDVKGSIQFSNCWGGARIPLIEQWVKDFNAIYPGVKIENDVSDCSPLREKQVTSLAGGSPPNVMMIKSDNTAFFAEQNALVPLDDLMTRDHISKEWYYPGEFKSRTWQGVTYGLPNVTAGALSMLFVNTGLLEKIGVDPKKPFETWQDLDALVEPAKKAGLLVMDPSKISTGLTAHMVWTYANGGKYWDDDLKKITWNDQAGVEAAEWLLQFVKAQGGKYENVAIASDPKNVIQPEDWAPEKYVACINGSWWFFQLSQKVPNLKYAAYTFPRNAKNPQSKGVTPSTGGWMFSIARSGKDQEAAWEWIKFTTTSQNACTFVQKQNRPSPVIACNENPELAKANPYWPVVTKTLQSDSPVPTTPIQPQFEQIWYDMNDAIMFERQAPKAALDSAASQAQQLLDDWNAKQKR